jgi:hypothetical protein
MLNGNLKFVTEIQRIWIIKCFVIPVIIVATEIVAKGLTYIWKQFQEDAR